MESERRDNQDPKRPGDEQDPEHGLEFLLWHYVDRINDGERIQAADVHSEHPEDAHSILEQLEAFQGIEAEFDSGKLLGTLGDYTLRRQIGRGGMGVVYEAWENSMDRAVALKVLPAGVAADDRAFQRFMQEAKTAGSLSHQSIVPVYSTGVKEGTPWFSMELVEGETLAQVIAQIKDAEPETETPFGKKSEQQFYLNLAKASADVADGLQHAHSRGVTHRDIKPSNLILDSDGRLRILDFGLAQLEGQDSLTISGAVVGTPLYMSPEQARRKKIPVDNRTDVYSLGATIYEAICGRPPFRGKNHADTLSQIIERNPVDPRSLNPRAPRDLETIVLKCLRKSPADRYGTAEALEQDLRRFVRGDAIEARPPTRVDRWRRWIHRRRLSISVVSLITLAALGVVGALLAERQVRLEWNRERYDSVVRRAAERTQDGQMVLSRGPLGGISNFISRPDRTRGGYEPDDTLIEDLELVASAAAGRVEAAYYLAQLTLRAGNDERALAWLDDALQREPDFVPAQYLRHYVEAELGHFYGEQVVDSLLADLAPEESWQRSWLEAKKYMSVKNWRRAAEAFGDLIRHHREGAEPYIGAAVWAYVGRGAARLRLDETIGAALDFYAARLLWPSFEEAHILLALALRKSGNHAQAHEVLADHYESKYATDRERFPLLAYAILRETDAGEEVEFWESKLSDLDRLRLRVTSEVFGQHDMRAARDTCDLILESNPKDRLGWFFAIWSRIFDTSERCGEDAVEERERATSFARRAVALYPTDRGIADAAAAAFASSGDRVAESAIRSSFEISRRFGAEAQGIHAIAASFERKRGRLDLALRSARSAVATRPGNIYFRAELASVLEARGDLEEAEQILRGMDWRKPRSLTRTLLARVLVKRGEFEEALSIAEEATRLRPINSPAWEVLALARWKSGKTESALEAVNEGLSRMPDRTKLLRLRAEILADAGRVREALEALGQGLLICPREPELAEELDRILAKAPARAADVAGVESDPSNASNLSNRLNRSEGLHAVGEFLRARGEDSGSTDSERAALESFRRLQRR